MKNYEESSIVSKNSQHKVSSSSSSLEIAKNYLPCEEEGHKDTDDLVVAKFNTKCVAPLSTFGFGHLRLYCRRHLWWWKWAEEVDKPQAATKTFNYFNLRLDLTFLFSVNNNVGSSHFQHCQKEEDKHHHEYQVQVQKHQQQKYHHQRKSQSLLRIAVLFVTVSSISSIPMKMCDIGVSLYNRYFGPPPPGLMPNHVESGSSSGGSSTSSSSANFPCGRRKNRRHHNKTKNHTRMVVVAKVKCQEPPPPLQLCSSSTSSTEEEEAVVKPRKVQFKDDATLVHILEFEDDEESRQNRMLYWEFFAADRCRFKDRIHRTQEVLEDIFNPEHRRKMKLYQEQQQCPLIEGGLDSKKEEGRDSSSNIPPEEIKNSLLTC